MDAQAFNELVRRNVRLIHKVAYAYCRDATDREDVVQEVLVQFWRSRHAYDPRFKETTWIYRIALNVAISFHRRERRHREGREPIDDLGPLDKALVLLHLDGNDHPFIADVLGISVSNVGTKLGRIKDKLRVAFEDRAGSNPTEGPHAAR
ncbi:MAG: RNA polymerase sigma factor [Candidatus Eiseniibacteriota bacterium]